MRILLVLLTLSFTASTASAAALQANIILAETSVVTFDPITFSAGPTIDVYHVVVGNPNSLDVTSLELSFPGTFQNFNSSPLSFSDSSDLPMLGPNKVAESFFVIPAGFSASDVLAVNTIDDETGLSSSYTLPGSTSFIDTGGSAVVAVLSVLEGTTLSADGFNGRASVNGQFENIGGNGCFYLTCPCDFHPNSPDCPEPSTALLIVLGIVGIAVRRCS